MPFTKVPILGKESIYVGTDVLEIIPNDLRSAVKSSRFALVTDENIASLYLEKVKDIFLKCGISLMVRVIPPGEGTKCRSSKEDIENWLLSERCGRDTCLIALGGGVIGDLTGFVAATYNRGVPFVQIPTSLLAMVDASIGGKTGVDTMHGKNLIGAFHQPTRIYIDIGFLKTLPERQFWNGMAEVIKTAAIWDPKSFDHLERNYELIEEKKTEDLYTMVLSCVRVKAEVVTLDEKEGGLREILNYGHSIGHAVEALMQPGMLHGEAVAIGMVKEAQLARYLNHLSPSNVGRMTRCVQAYHLPVAIPPALAVDDLMAKMAVDKKNKQGKKYLVLLKSMGECLDKKAISIVDDDIRIVLSQSISVVPPVAPVQASISVPGSKSISNRALLLAALGTGRCELVGLLHSDDTQVMMDGLTKLGCGKFEWKNDGQTLLVHGCGGKQMKVPDGGLYLGNAGTASRFLTSLCTLLNEPGKGAVLMGDKRMHQRPIGPLIDSLRSNGCDIQYQGKEGCLPLKIAAKGFKGGAIDLSATISSQYVSSILLSAPYAKEEVTLRLVGTVASPLYIDMTVEMMRQFGATVEKQPNNTYVVRRKPYINPSRYVVEADASSSTYPLAIAAITGGTVSANHIHSASIQGDAKFHLLLQKMGCTVNQDNQKTTVTGPAGGRLRPLDVDMTDLTDAFMTAAVLAAVAPGVSRITGIANQRVKECDRIAAMAGELGKCGVKCVELADGLEVHGRPVAELHGARIECYNDHRIAMSFAVLGCKVPGIIITDKACVEKTYPEFWDQLHLDLKIGLNEGKSSAQSSDGEDGPPHKKARLSCVEDATETVLLIGMRGAGKTFLGKAAASELGMVFMDADHEFEKQHGPISEFVKANGWDGFRKIEVKMLAEMMSAHPTGHIIALGGGIVETEAGRAALKKYKTVVEVRRDITDVCNYLNADKSRPSLGDPPEVVFKRRDAWYIESSRYQFYVRKGDMSIEGITQDFLRFMRHLTGKAPSVPTSFVPPISPDYTTFFLSLTFPDLSPVISLLPTITAGVHAVELRVDLLKDYSEPFVADQIATLRRHCALPIIYTVRSKSQGGKFPDDEIPLFKLMAVGVRQGCEYVDMETCWSLTQRANLLDSKGRSKVIASFHDPAGRCTWPEMKLQMEEASHSGKADVVKIVGMANSIGDVFSLRQLLQQVELSQPVIAICMGEHGKLSRVLNRYLTPVTHPALPMKAAPGQLSVAEIFAIQHQLGQFPAKRFYLFGHPISKSMSPTIHNTGFQTLGLPHRYALSESADVEHVKSVLATPDFGGASVTIPHKQSVIPLLKQLSPSARAIGAVNTIIPQPDGSLSGDNTDWLAMYQLIVENLRASGKPSAKGLNGLVVGAGGTARAAMYVMQQLGLAKRLIYNRTYEKAEALASEFGGTALKSLDKLSDIHVIIATIPAPAQTADMLPASVLAAKPVVMDLAYRPRRTPILKQAEVAGCKTIEGIQLLITQGLYQFRIWTGCNPPAEIISTTVMAAYAASE